MFYKHLLFVLFQDLVTRPDRFYIGHTDVNTAGDTEDILNEDTTYNHTWDGAGKYRAEQEIWRP